MHHHLALRVQARNALGHFECVGLLLGADISVLHGLGHVLRALGHQRHETPAVQGLDMLKRSHTRHFQEGRIKIFRKDGGVDTGARRGLAGPADHHRYADSAQVAGTLPLAQRGVLLMRDAAFRGDVGIAAVIGHEHDDGVVRDVVGFQVIHQVAQAFVYALHHGGKLGLAGIQAHLFLVSVEKPRVLRDGRMGGVMGHVQVERLAAAHRFLQRLERLARDGFREENVLPVILRHVLHGHIVPLFGGVAEVLGSIIRARHTVHRTRHIHHETHVVGRCTRSSGGRPVGFSHVDGVVACIAQMPHHRGGYLHAGDTLRTGPVRAKPVDVPVRPPQRIRIRGIVLLIGKETAVHPVAGDIPQGGCPVGDTHVGGVHAGHHGRTRRRGHRAGIGAGQDYAFARQPLHVGRMEMQVAGIDFLAVRHAGIHPAVVVHQEKDDIGSLFGQGRHCRRQEGRPQKGRFPNDHMHGSVIVTAPAGRCRGWYRRAGPRADRGCAGWDCRGNAARYPAAPG